MQRSFENKIRKIVLTQIENEKFGVSELAGELGLSRSQVLRRVKSETGKSANQLIREIRLEQAVELLNNEELTASEIAYKVGFSSPSYFNKCFSDYFGYTPGDYKKLNEKVEIDSILSEDVNAPTFRFKKNLGRILSVVVFALIIFFTISRLQKNKINKQIQQASIAVLPLWSLSENQDKKHWAIGLTDAITLELSKIDGLRVTSRGSAMLFKDSLKLYSEIAEILGVDLLLEGSISYSSDSLKVIVQLIKPFPDEKHLWAEKYEKNASNVYSLADEISKQIAKEINLVVSNKEENSKIKEIDPKAYELYLMGNTLRHYQNPKAVTKAIKLLQEAISIDPDFAPPYSALAEAYILENKWNKDYEQKRKNRESSRHAINNALRKAIELDEELAEAYFTMGNVYGKFDWDWESMKRMAEKGLALSPSSPEGHTLLSKYYLLKGNYKKAIVEALEAKKYNPIHKETCCFLAEVYFIAGMNNESIEEYKRVLELYPNSGFAWDGIGYVQFISGQKEEAINTSWKNLHTIMGNNSMAEFFGTNGVNLSLNHWLDGAIQDSTLLCSNPTIIAQAYMFVEKREETLQFLERAYEFKNEDLPIMLLRPHFEPLHTNPRFKELMKKVGVSLN